MISPVKVCDVVPPPIVGKEAPLSDSPSDSPSESPTDSPSESPTDSPSESPSESPTDSPSDQPTTPCVEEIVMTEGNMKPLKVVFAVDSTGSMGSTNDKQGRRKDAVRSFIDKMNNEWNNDQNEAALISWSGCGDRELGDWNRGSYRKACNQKPDEVEWSKYEKNPTSKSDAGNQNPIQFVTTMTSDLDKIKEASHYINDNGWTNPDLGMMVSVETMRRGVNDEAEDESSEKVIIFLTDGRPQGQVGRRGHQNQLTPIGTECDQGPAAAAKSNGYTIYTIGLGQIGTSSTSMRTQDEENLRQWAECTGGEYLAARTADDLTTVYDAIFDKIKAKNSYQKTCGGEIVSYCTEKMVEVEERRPVEIVFSIDATGSMETASQKHDVDRIRVKASAQFVNNLDPSKDKVGVVSWSGCEPSRSGYANKCSTAQDRVEMDKYLTASEFNATLDWRNDVNRNKKNVPIQFVEPLQSLDDGKLDYVVSSFHSINSYGYTNPDLGMEVALQVFQDAEDSGLSDPDAMKVILFLTDGEPLPTWSQKNKFTDIGESCSVASSPAKVASDRGIVVYTVGLDEDIDIGGLERWADCTGGFFTQAKTANALTGVFETIYDSVQKKSSLQIVCDDDV
eukprot:CAMPEP_0113474066 /NCGR_PEP_ID=MMETSP0014_2-20120614/18383_1 /TAXON_ID=2857 /ORGANISM="Nitzschia sp." /LENGTH=621 /DNA_ID=CAMNT_0000366883 /DNA_START=367 /DNA_END=2232 /DNA_ORIENTATION=+ /assembly_acc=CAM_ASM_000159